MCVLSVSLHVLVVTIPHNKKNALFSPSPKAGNERSPMSAVSRFVRDCFAIFGVGNYIVCLRPPDPYRLKAK